MSVIVAADETLFFDLIERYLKQKELVCVRDAYEMARQAHGDQRRKSGEPFFVHPLTVAYYLAEYHLDTAALVAALLHDVAEDTRVSVSEIKRQFGADASRLVGGVTKLKSPEGERGNGRYHSRQEIQDATLHNLLDTMTADVRVVIIKLFDRLHNMRTIKVMRPDQQFNKANETLSVYAPLANRLGMWKIKNELEAISLEIVHHKAFYAIQEQLQEIQKAQQRLSDQIIEQIYDCLLATGLDIRKVSLESPNVYSVFKDLQDRGASHNSVDVPLRLEVLVGDDIACYMALAQLHQLWKPVPGKLDDYIANPRDNLYRSLHTTVVHSSGQHIKLRIRTEAMDKVSEVGVLAKWLYADTPLWSEGIAGRMDAFFDSIREQIHANSQDVSASVRAVVEDVFGTQIQVYTPQGDMHNLVMGATAVDFAYAIHTGLGNQCQAAYVNNELYPLNKPLQNGDRVRIEKREGAQPQRAWLDEDLGYIITNYARNHIRRWFRRLPDETAILQGKQLLEDELKVLQLSEYNHQKIATSFGYSSKKLLYYDMGRAELLPTVVATRVLEDTWALGPALDLDNVVYDVAGEQYIVTNADGRRLQLCRTCIPQPGDIIVGFLRKDNAVTVHKESCHSIRPDRSTGRLLKLGWGETNTRQARLMTFEVKVYDRPGLLFEIAQLLHHEKINISYIHTPPRNRRGETRIIISAEVVRPRHLVRVLHQIQALVNVYEVQILRGGPPPVKEDYLPPSLYRPE